MKRSTLAALGLCVLLPVFSATAVRAQSAFPAQMMGPADLRNQRPYQLLALAFSPQAATVLPAGRSAASIQFDLADDLLIPKPTNGVAVHEQAETQRLDFAERRGLGHGLEASVSIPVIARDGGVMDKLIANYHVLIGDTHTTPDDAIGRSHVTPYHSDIYFTRPDGTDAAYLHPAAGIGDTQATIKQALWSNGHTAGTIRAGLKLPTGSAGNYIGSGSVDSGVDFDAQARLGRKLAAFGNISYVWLGKDDRLDGYWQRRMRRGTVALEYYTSSHSSWVLQNDISDAAVRTGNAFADGNQAVISLAYKYSPRPSTLLTYAFTENGGVVADKVPWLANVGPDPTFSFGLARFF